MSYICLCVCCDVMSSCISVVVNNIYSFAASDSVDLNSTQNGVKKGIFKCF